MEISDHHRPGWLPGRNWLTFFLLNIIMMWVTHAIALFAHEYSHSFTAWLLGWKTNPFALNYGQLTLSNVLAQFDIDENVNYKPIFATGHGQQAGLVALAGLLIGNLLLTYPLSLLGFKFSKKNTSRVLTLFFYWLCVTSVGNLIDYVPVRTFAYSGDMHTVCKGFNCSPWFILICLGIPFVMILMHFVFNYAPQALYRLFPDSKGMRLAMIILTSLAMFGFYGAAGWGSKDPVSHYMSVVSVSLFVPLTIIAGLLFDYKFQKDSSLHHN
ncbi:hypothetical protein ACFQZI_18510 [Mucilaginibacter lutimaris]|uniref:Uncharacterized protein n=1 Tax=Mucilaginibacter lutimaris TaxID=931629 RepID=A0ABW2ZKU2_9SPHI